MLTLGSILLYAFSNIVFFNTFLWFFSRIAGYETIKDFYQQSSCSMYLDNITIPVVFINALDDPIIPEPLLKWPKQYAGILTN